ncbi:MAG TPA: ribosomal RNA small subunit methyltransferase A [Firmicutes bacterium]|nr:ribosomal RNA small subunit methyltransferase A [Bacillota bacterium]
MTELPDLTSPRELKLYLGEKKLQPRRSMGQNFLIDRNIAAKIVEAAALRGGDPVVEIGPGAGALTVALAAGGMRVVAVELDRGLAAALARMLLPRKNVSVLLEDALRVDWGALQRRYFSPGEAVTLLSNLPYNISTPLLYALYKQGFPFKKAILMFQNEVARRLTAEPGRDYGALSVLSRYYTIPEILFSVSRSSFWPRPEVDSAVVALRRRHREPDAAEESLLWEIVQTAFQQRRKMISNSLRPLGLGDELILILRQAGVDPAARAEMLSVEQFAKIAQIAYNRSSVGKHR